MQATALPSFSLLPPPSSFLQLPGVRIHFRVVGEGPPILLLHGLASSGIDWFPIAPALASRHRLILMDLRGHGHSSLAQAKGYGIETMAGDAWRLLEALAVDKPHVVGLSLGGCVALQMACQRPAALDRLVLANTFARLRSNGLLASRLIRLRRTLGNIDALAQVVATSLFNDPAVQAFAAERLRRNDMGAIRRTMAALALFDVRRRLPRIANPVLVLAGDRDRTVPSRCTEELAGGLPLARLHIIADAGHALPYDQPDAFVAAVRDFLPIP